MSYTHLIKETLDILDLSVTFNENCLTKEKYKGQICHIYRGNLIYTAQECIHCKHQIASDIVRWGTTTVRLLMNDVSECRTYLELKSNASNAKLVSGPLSQILLLRKNTVSSVRKSAGLS